MRQRSYSDLVVRVCSPHRPLYYRSVWPIEDQVPRDLVERRTAAKSTISLLEDW